MEYAYIIHARLCPCNILGCDLQAKIYQWHVSTYYLLYSYIHMEYGEITSANFVHITSWDVTSKQKQQHNYMYIHCILVTFI